MTTLALKQANKIIESALRKARELKLNPMTVAVVDTYGVPIALAREDGVCPSMRPDIALGKARAAIVLGPKGSRFWQDDFKARPNFVQTLMHIGQGDFLPGAGGVAILDKNQNALGGIGCTGDLSDQDERIAILAVQEAGLIAAPDAAQALKEE